MVFFNFFFVIYTTTLTESSTDGVRDSRWVEAWPEAGEPSCEGTKHRVDVGVLDWIYHRTIRLLTHGGVTAAPGGLHHVASLG